MPALATSLTYKRLLEGNETLRMLRADNLAVMAAVLREHLSSPGARIAAEDLHERIDGELEILRDHFALSSKNAKAYCDDWRGAGILIRRPASSARGETYELSAAGVTAIRMLDQLDTPRSTLTESRLVSLAAVLRQLAIDTDPDASRRLHGLERERERIDAEIARIHKGELTVIDDRRAQERVADILMQAQDLPADFARVRSRFEQINHELRSSILNTDDTQSTVLDDIFRGVDLIEESDEGRTFAAFAALIRDPERYAAFDDDVAAILDRDFSVHLDSASRRALRTLMRDMKNGSREVHAILTDFARGLRRYVHSQEFQRDRALRRLLQDALAAAVPAARYVKPYSDAGRELEITAMRMFSLGEVVAHDPSEFDTGRTLDDDEPGVVDFAALAAIARESEIDFVELIANVNHSVTSSSPVSVGDVLDQYPATQGVASVIGLLSLATQFGRVDRKASEEVSWYGTDDVERVATVHRHEFTERVDE